MGDKFDIFCCKCKNRGTSYCQACEPDGSGDGWCYFEEKEVVQCKQ